MKQHDQRNWQRYRKIHEIVKMQNNKRHTGKREKSKKSGPGKNSYELLSSVHGILPSIDDVWGYKSILNMNKMIAITPSTFFKV